MDLSDRTIRNGGIESSWPRRMAPRLGTVRSLYPIILGLGGWLLGTLIVLGAVAAANLALILLDMARPAPPMTGFPPTPFWTRGRRPPSRRHPPAL